MTKSIKKESEPMAIEVPTLDTITRGYLAMNQLDAFLSHSKAQVTATVETPASCEIRKFSWLLDGNDRAVLVNRVTGTLYDPATGSAMNARPRLLEAPIEPPPLIQGKRLPAGIYSTAKA